MFSNDKMNSTDAPQSKKVFGLMIMFMLLMVFLPFVSSAPPVTSVQQFTEGYVLKYPSDQVIKQNENYEFEIHVYNISDGFPVTSSLSCYFHLYNSTGRHHLELVDVTPSHNFDYSFNVLAPNFTELGDYYYLVQCNSTRLGGYIEVPFQVTPNGLIVDEGTSTIYIGLLAVLLVFLAMTIYSFTQFDNLLNRVGMIGIGYLLIMSITFIGWNMAEDYLISSPFLIDMFRILFFVFIIGFFPLVIGGFIWYFLQLWKIKEIQSLMDKGMGEDEAQRRVSRR